MKSSVLFGWIGVLSLVSTVGCKSDPEDFCEGWAEHTCNAMTICCNGGALFDEAACRVDLSRSCQNTTEVEKVHSGELIFDSGLASECFGTISSCEDFASSKSDSSLSHAKACANMLTGFRPLGAACAASSECEQSGEYATCYDGRSGSGGGVCAKVVVDEAMCGFSFDTNELHVCPEGTYCTAGGFKPNSSDAPTVQAFEFTAKCVSYLGLNARCSAGGDGVPCGGGLFCDVSGAADATCKARKGAGESCQSTFECQDGLFCAPGEGVSTQTCRKADENGPYCFTPAT